MNEESKMLSYIADLCHPWISENPICLVQNFVLIWKKMHCECLISTMSFWVICTLIVIKTCDNLHSVCYQKLYIHLPRQLIFMRPQKFWTVFRLENRLLVLQDISFPVYFDISISILYSKCLSRKLKENTFSI